MKKYYPRLIESKIESKLKSSGAVLVAGPKFCGKTTTCMNYQKSFIKLNTRQTIDLAKINPKGVLIGEKPRLIDEWQTVPDIWNQVKDALDFEYAFGQFILTGSSTPADKTQIHHSGAGRIVPLKMRPMSLYESEESKGIVSISELFNNSSLEFFDINNDFQLADAAYLLCRGGWPISVQDDRDLGLEITRNYYDSLFVFENSENERFRNKKPEVFKMILRSYARNISTEAPYTTIIEDIKSSNSRTMDSKTFDDYMDALKDLFIIEDLLAWNPNIRSKTSIRTSPTRHFVDTSIACRALNISPNDLLNDLKSFGYFFEDFAVRDLSIYASTIDGEINHYRDNTGLECDAILRLPSNKWAAIEIKLGGEKLIQEGADSLNRLKEKLLNKSDETTPAFMMILTACGPLYKRPDGIYVVPINCLRP
ncbi:MAG: ATP-binding protein [Clostridiales bacterium]|nr:ATP-binding protein [Clostridiales bacterium]